MSQVSYRRARLVWGLVGAFLCMAAASGAARAQGYDFNRFLSGGGGGQDPAKRQLAQSMGAHVCLGVAQGRQPGTVDFLVWSRIPQPNSRVTVVAFDLGRHAGLLRSVSVNFGSPGVKGVVAPPQAHPFLRGMTPEFWVDVPQAGHLKSEGLGPGRMISISAVLGPGKTAHDVLAALHEGLSPTGGASGLRVGVIVRYWRGGPPPGVATIQDDGGFVTAGPSNACR